MAEHNYLKDRLNEGLFEEEMEEVKPHFIRYLVVNQINPKMVAVNYQMVDAVIRKMAEVNPEWSMMPPIDGITQKVAIQHLKGHLNNQRRDACKNLLKKMKEMELTLEKVKIEQGEQDDGKDDME